MKSFRIHHLFQFLNYYETQKLPFDFCLSQYFKNNSAIGSKDKAEIADNAYKLIRWKGLIDYKLPANPTWEQRIEKLFQPDFEEWQKDESIPIHVRASFPKDLYQLFIDSLGDEEAYRLAMISNSQAPTTIRVNTLKTSRETLWNKWKNLYQISLCKHSPWGIVFHQKIHFFSLPEFKEGLFEIQDEGSQLLADLVEAKPGQHVLDYCAGAGGKSLAFGTKMQNKGQMYLHDIRTKALLEAKVRMKRSGLQNVQFLQENAKQLMKLKKKMDWVLVDAPCSGTGTLRRNPDMKWRFEIEMIQRLVGQQRQIFEKALSYLNPSGKIVYGTCSILRQENEEQMEHFLKTYPLEIVNSPLLIRPENNGMDGFFGVVFQWKKKNI